MPTVEHSTLTTTNLHEPKGASTASEGMIYRADGAGSGDWTYLPEGWGQYADLSSGSQVFNNTRAKLQLDSLGATTIESYLPREIRGTGSLWDGTNDVMTPITAFDSYNIRVDLPVTAESGSPTDIVFELDIGSPIGVVVTRYLTPGRTTPYSLNLSFGVYAGATFLANGGAIYLKTDTGTVTVTNPSVFIQRISSGAF